MRVSVLIFLRGLINSTNDSIKDSDFRQMVQALIANNDLKPQIAMVRIG
jgi:hypothetical protein